MSSSDVDILTLVVPELVELLIDSLFISDSVDASSFSFNDRPGPRSSEMSPISVQTYCAMFVKNPVPQSTSLRSFKACAGRDIIIAAGNDDDDCIGKIKGGGRRNKDIMTRQDEILVLLCLLSLVMAVLNLVPNTFSLL